MIIPEINVYSAIVRNDLTMLKKAIEIENINIREDNTFTGDSIFNRDFTLLHITAELGRPQLAQYLIDQGADLHKGSSMGHKPIDVAASHGHHNVIDVFLDAGMHVDARNPIGYQPTQLPWYQVNGLLYLWRWCMGMNGEVRPGPKVITPLAFAAMEGHLETMSFLLEHGAQIDGDVLGDVRGRTPLSAAAASNQREAVTWLLEKGADINMRGNRGVAIEVAIAMGKKEMLKLLIDLGADVNAIGSLDGTALHKAATKMDVDFLKILLEHGADINAKTIRGLTPLHVAADFDRPENIKLLLEHGADMNALTDEGRTPLLEAASRHNPKAMQTLLELGADPDVRDNKGYKAADYQPLPIIKHEHNDISSSVLKINDVLCGAESDVFKAPPPASNADSGGYYTTSWQEYIGQSVIDAFWSNN
jgi:ankyrin repeat protein